MVALLLKYNARKDLCDFTGKTAMDYALESRNPMADEIIE